MPVQALLIGAIGVLAETSDLQRRSFNEAFADAGLDWTWQADAYREMLTKAGGARRVLDYASSRGETVDADAIHEAKTRIFNTHLKADGHAPRDGVVETLASAKAMGVKLAFVTTTSRNNVDAILEATGIPDDTFDLVMDRSMVEKPKPDGEAYTIALSRLGVSAETAVAIEDTPESAAAAVAAGIRTIAFPGAMADAARFTNVERIVAVLSPDLLD